MYRGPPWYDEGNIVFFPIFFKQVSSYREASYIDEYISLLRLSLFISKYFNLLVSTLQNPSRKYYYINFLPNSKI